MGEYRLKIGVDEFGKEVQNAGEFTQTIIRDFNDKLYRLRGDYNLKAWQGLYALLYANLVTDGICSSNEARLYFRGDAAEAFSELWRGQIKPQDGEYDLINSSVDTQILDNSWSSRINNSQNQTVKLRTNRSINQEAIAECPYFDCDFYNPTDGSYYADSRRCFNVKDCFTFLVNYYTDNTATFESDYFSTGGPGEQYYITTGEELRLYDGFLNPEISFSQLFDEVNKKFNLWIIVESDDFDNPVIRIESYDYVLLNTPSITIENPESVVVKTNLDLLYTIIQIGSTQTEFDGLNANYPNKFYYSWNAETYNNTGSCQWENNVINLTSAWKIDSNSIEQQLKGDEDFDDDIFIVEIDPSTLNAYQFTDQFTTQTAFIDYFYNYNLTNAQVISNWEALLPESDIRQLSIDYFVSVNGYTVSGAPGTFEPLEFPTEVADVYDIYSTGDFLFTAPVTGYYRFTGSASVTTSNTARIFSLRVRTWPDDSLTGLGTAYYGPTQTGSTSYVLAMDREVYLQGGWVARAEVFINLTDTIDILASEMVMTVEELPSISGNPLTYEYDIDQFQLSVADFNTIRDSRGYVRFLDTITGRAWNVWPTEMTYSHEKQLVTKGTFIGRSPLNILTDLCWVLEGQYGLGAWDDECYWIDGYGWVDFCSDVVSNPIFAGNPVTDWSLTQGTQIAENQFQTPAIGNVIISQSITLAAGSYTLYYNVTVDNTSPWLVSAALTGSTGLGNLFSLSTNLNESGEVSFTYTGGTNTLTITGNDGAPPPQTIFTFNLINIC